MSTLAPKGKPQFFTVHLVQKFMINLVMVYNRKDACCAGRIDGAEVYAGTHKCGTIRYIPGHNVYHLDCSGVEADFVKVLLPEGFLNLAEVQVYGKSNIS